MARFRLTRPAQSDLAAILAASTERWGGEGRRRYAKLLISAMRQIAATPDGPLCRKRNELLAGLRSFHLRHARSTPDSRRVRQPVHVLYYRAATPDLIEIVRVLHERMEPSRHLDDTSTSAG